MKGNKHFGHSWGKAYDLQWWQEQKNILQLHSAISIPIFFPKSPMFECTWVWCIGWGGNKTACEQNGTLSIPLRQAQYAKKKRHNALAHRGAHTRERQRERERVSREVELPIGRAFISMRNIVWLNKFNKRQICKFVWNSESHKMGKCRAISKSVMVLHCMTGPDAAAALHCCSGTFRLSGLAATHASRRRRRRHIVVWYMGRSGGAW